MFQRLFRNGAADQEERLANGGAALPEGAGKVPEKDGTDAGNDSSGMKTDLASEGLPDQEPASDSSPATSPAAAEVGRDLTTAPQPAEKSSRAVQELASPVSYDVAGDGQRSHI